MPIPVIQFQPESFEAANPFLTGAQVGQQMVGRGLEQQNLTQQIQQAMMANQLQRATQPGQISATNAQNQGIVAQQPSLNRSNIATNEANAQTALKQRLAQIALQNAQSQQKIFNVNHPELNIKSDPISQSIWLDKVKNQYGENSPIYQQALQGIKIQQQKWQSLSDYSQKLAQGMAWNKLPVENKSQDLAYAAGMGYSQQEASDRFLHGETLQQLADEKGVKLSDVNPQYAPTESTKTTQQSRNAAFSELDRVSDEVNDWITPYSRTIGGISPQQLIDSLTGKNKEGLAKYWAAKALVPDLASIRSRMQIGGRIGIETIREFTNAAYGRLSALPISRDPQVFRQAQKLIDEKVRQMAEAANKSTLKTYSNKNSSNNNSWIYDPNTGKLVPEGGR